MQPFTITELHIFKIYILMINTKEEKPIVIMKRHVLFW